MLHTLHAQHHSCSLPSIRRRCLAAAAPGRSANIGFHAEGHAQKHVHAGTMHHACAWLPWHPEIQAVPYAAHHNRNRVLKAHLVGGGREVDAALQHAAVEAAKLGGVALLGVLEAADWALGEEEAEHACARGTAAPVSVVAKQAHLEEGVDPSHIQCSDISTPCAASSALQKG